MVHDIEFNPITSRITRIRIEPVINTALNCQFCADAACIKACQLNAIKQDPETKIIQVLDACDGCGACIKSCPFGVISLHTSKNKALFCDLCKNTDEGVPQCIEYCPKGAIYLLDVEVDDKEDVMEVSKNLSRGPFPEEAQS
jgi:Fe-S-cluster-containing hydrogenase component 2